MRVMIEVPALKSLRDRFRNLVTDQATDLTRAECIQDRLDPRDQALIASRLGDLNATARYFMVHWSENGSPSEMLPFGGELLLTAYRSKISKTPPHRAGGYRKQERILTRTIQEAITELNYYLTPKLSEE